MAGISDEAVETKYAENKYRYTGRELQNRSSPMGLGWRSMIGVDNPISRVRPHRPGGGMTWYHW